MTAGATFGDIADSLAARLATISGLKAEPRPPAKMNLPMAVVEGFEAAERATLDGCWRWRVIITVYLARANDRASFDRLYTLASPGAGGVWAALENSAASDDCDYVIIEELRDTGVYQVADMEMLGFQIVCQVGA